MKTPERGIYSAGASPATGALRNKFRAPEQIKLDTLVAEMQSNLPFRLLKFLRHAPATVEQIADELDVKQSTVRDCIARMKAAGHNLNKFDNNGHWSLEREPQTGGHLGHKTGEAGSLISDKDGWHLLGAMGDTHLCSKHERLAELHDLYRIYENNGVKTVLHSGNYIDGEARFNKYELKVHGMDAQLAYLAEHYPQKKGMRTLMISGDDHEGWYGQREGVDIGFYMQTVMERAGRHDIFNAGYMECFLPLQHAISGKKTMLHLLHPGGGSAYATSYTVQKIVECVPLDSEILTPTGWKKHNRISRGDLVMGYNVAEDRCEWTPILSVHVGSGEVVKYSNDQIEIRCTPAHKWAIEWQQRAGPNPKSRKPVQYSRRERRLWTITESKNRSRIIQAALAPDGAGLPSAHAMQWLDRTGAEATVMKMSSGERRAFIEGMLVGEGTVAGRDSCRTVAFCQNPGPVHDAFRLACFLEGIATTSRPAKPGSFKPQGAGTRRVTVLKKRLRIVNKKFRCGESLGRQEVWCPTTALGTWVMRQGDCITITGNSYEGGEKPAVLFAGHYHKAEHLEVRNVHCFQTGCFQDQTVFARKKKLTFTIGGWLVMFRQNPDTGAVEEVVSYFKSYFNRGYYQNNRWSLSGPVALVPRLKL